MEPGRSMGTQVYRFTVCGASRHRLCGFMIAAIREKGKRYTYIKYTHSIHTSHIQSQHLIAAAKYAALAYAAHFGPILASLKRLGVDIMAHTKTRGKPFWGHSFFVTIGFQYGYRLGITGIAWVSLLESSRPNQTAPYNLNGCQDHEISHAFQGLQANINEQILFQNVARYLFSQFISLSVVLGHLEDKRPLQ